MHIIKSLFEKTKIENKKSCKNDYKRCNRCGYTAYFNFCPSEHPAYDSGILSLLSVIASCVSIVAGLHSDKMFKKNLNILNDISFFENAIEDSEDII